MNHDSTSQEGFRLSWFVHKSCGQTTKVFRGQIASSVRNVRKPLLNMTISLRHAMYELAVLIFRYKKNILHKMFISSLTSFGFLVFCLLRFANKDRENKNLVKIAESNELHKKPLKDTKSRGCQNGFFLHSIKNNCTAQYIKLTFPKKFQSFCLYFLQIEQKKMKNWPC